MTRTIYINQVAFTKLYNAFILDKKLSKDASHIIGFKDNNPKGGRTSLKSWDLSDLISKIWLMPRKYHLLQNVGYFKTFL